MNDKKEWIANIKTICKKLSEVENIITSGGIDDTLLSEYEHEERYLNTLLEELLKPAEKM